MTLVVARNPYMVLLRRYPYRTTGGKNHYFYLILVLELKNLVLFTDLLKNFCSFSYHTKFTPPIPLT